MKSLAVVYVICTSLTVCSGTSSAQSRAAKSSRQGPSNSGQAWEVPANSRGNRLVLTVENFGDQQTESILLKVQNAPPYVHFDPSELLLKPLAPGQSVEVKLTFSVDRGAALGQVDNIVLALSSSTSSWQKELSFTYLQPSTYKLEQNFPNPFNPSTTIQYQLPSVGRVTLKLYDVLGREVATLVDKEQEAGYYDVVWEGGKSATGRNASGVYFYRLGVQSGGGSSYSSMKKMLLLK